MKNLLTLCFVLIINVSFAQEKSATLRTNFNEENKNSLLTSTRDINIIRYQEIVPVDFENKKNRIIKV